MADVEEGDRKLSAVVAVKNGGDENDDDDDDDQSMNLRTSSTPPQDNAEQGYDTAEDEDANHHVDDETIEPMDSKINSLSFASCCKRLEYVFRKKMEKKASKRLKERERLEVILPKAMLRDLGGQTIYPYLRLLLPEQDSLRQYAMQDRKVAEMYCNALGFAKKSTNYEMMYDFTNPSKVPEGCAGDLSLVVEHILKLRIPKEDSKITIGKINELLDEMNNLRAYSNRGRAHHNHQWRESQSQDVAAVVASKESNKPSLSQLRSRWLQKVMSKGLSPLEHKWLVRILLKRMRNSVGSTRLLNWISPYAQELWNSHNNLKKVCAIIADPSFTTRRQELEELRKKQSQGLASLWEPQVEKAVLGNVISPMISIRSSFDKLMTQTQANHHNHLKRYFHPSTKQHRPLSLQFPALTAEIKLDGERFIVHVNNGRVTMNTRRSKWYSDLYAPVLGPPLRRALAKYPKLNVILDGEIESWDDSKKCLIPFGENRTVANYRRAYLQHHNLIDPLDEELHPDEDDPNVQRTSSDYFSKKVTVEHDEKVARGEYFWLKFMAFDILYVDGEDGRRLFDDCGVSSDNALGSIIHLPLMKRKQLLYRLLTTQEKEIEICPTRVIRCNGEFLSGEEYFSTTDPVIEFGYEATELDSTQATLESKIPNLEALDEQRMLGRSATEISRMRARAMEGFYVQIVEEYKFEGLVVKDLASPYIMGERKYWWKFKPDYESGEAVDIDVVILGASFATGLRDGGTPSSYLVGVVDQDDTSSFMTFSTINANSVRNEVRAEMWKHTGFKPGGDGNSMQLGKWFREENYALPEFISQKSRQRGTVVDYEGWTFNKAKGTYPHLWIDPNDSIVLEIKGQELIISEEHSAGLCLRFPKIKRVRLESVDGDEKKPSEITTDGELWNLYDTTRAKRLEADAAIHGGQSQSSGLLLFDSNTSASGPCRFLTPEEYSRKNKKRGARATASPARKIPKVDENERKSDALFGLTFVVLEGKYELKPDSLEAREAEEQGWIAEARKVKTEADVMEFILKHHGTVKSSLLSGSAHEFCIGGSNHDARVQNQLKGLEAARRISNPTTAAQRRLVELTRSVDGILKWTFVYTLVHRFLETENEESILECNKNWLIPGPQDYLARVQRETSVEEEIFCLDRMITETEMQRALVTPGRRKKEDEVLPPWQYQGLDLPLDERWILSSRFTTLWPYREVPDDHIISHSKEVLVLYPDVFDDLDIRKDDETMERIRSGSDAKRWDEVLENSDELMSVLPLAKLMGALVTPFMHSGVNTILCRLKSDIEDITWNGGSMMDGMFQDEEKGQQLMQKLRMGIGNQTFRLVSPEWVRKQSSTE
ncbi:ATP dependent DNA ligase domain containing protein [Nitzschia inconspicua]|uniref:ATP dependent DNA ligase domain containing protein n=1 Tax=Nitzschia inconspicua TaxID=303405 RepID=A0A9K3LQW2_9STRA|nr:ATP dependent DNA ligase domain containing protein [Nitzschia inconspicua]